MFKVDVACLDDLEICCIALGMKRPSTGCRSRDTLDHDRLTEELFLPLIWDIRAHPLHTLTKDWNTYFRCPGAHFMNNLCDYSGSIGPISGTWSMWVFRNLKPTRRILVAISAKGHGYNDFYQSTDNTTTGSLQMRYYCSLDRGVNLFSRTPFISSTIFEISGHIVSVLAHDLYRPPREKFMCVRKGFLSWIFWRPSDHVIPDCSQSWTNPFALACKLLEHAHLIFTRLDISYYASFDVSWTWPLNNNVRLENSRFVTFVCFFPSRWIW